MAFLKLVRWMVVAACLVFRTVASTPAAASQCSDDAATGAFSSDMPARPNPRSADSSTFSYRLLSDDTSVLTSPRHTHTFKVVSASDDVRSARVSITPLDGARCGAGQLNPPPSCPHTMVLGWRGGAEFGWMAPKCDCVSISVRILTDDGEQITDRDRSVAGPLTRIMCVGRLSDVVPRTYDLHALIDKLHSQEVPTDTEEQGADGPRAAGVVANRTREDGSRRRQGILNARFKQPLTEQSNSTSAASVHRQVASVEHVVRKASISRVRMQENIRLTIIQLNDRLRRLHELSVTGDLAFNPECTVKTASLRSPSSCCSMASYSSQLHCLVADGSKAMAAALCQFYSAGNPLTWTWSGHQLPVTQRRCCPLPADERATCITSSSVHSEVEQ